MQALQKAQDNFEQAQQEVMQAQTELEMLMQEAPLPVMPVAQVNVSLVKTVEALTCIIENLWNPDAGQPPENLIHAIQESRQILQTSVILSQEGGAALDAEVGAELDPELWDQDEDEAEEMADFEEAHAPGEPPMEATRAHKATAEGTPMTSPPKKTQTTEPWAAEQGDGQAAEVQRLSARAVQNPRDTDFWHSRNEHALIPALASS